MTIQTAEQKLKAELRSKTTIELHHLITSRETPEVKRNIAQEVLFEREKK